jgi:hypothetical protein
MTDQPYPYTDTEVRRFAARVIREYVRLSGPLTAANATYEVSMQLMGDANGPDLTDALNARIVEQIAQATVTLSWLAADRAPAVAVGWPTDPE